MKNVSIEILRKKKKTEHSAKRKRTKEKRKKKKVKIVDDKVSSQYLYHLFVNVKFSGKKVIYL